MGGSACDIQKKGGVDEERWGAAKDDRLWLKVCMGGVCTGGQNARAGIHTQLLVTQPDLDEE